MFDNPWLYATEIFPETPLETRPASPAETPPPAPASPSDATGEA